MEKEFNLDKELEKWFNKWHRKTVTGRCIIELKQIEREFIKRLKERIQFGLIETVSEDARVEAIINELAGDKLIDDKGGDENGRDRIKHIS